MLLCKLINEIEYKISKYLLFAGIFGAFNVIKESVQENDFLLILDLLVINWEELISNIFVELNLGVLEFGWFDLWSSLQLLFL